MFSHAGLDTGVFSPNGQFSGVPHDRARGLYFKRSKFFPLLYRGISRVGVVVDLGPGPKKHMGKEEDQTLAHGPGFTASVVMGLIRVILDLLAPNSKGVNALNPNHNLPKPQDLGFVVMEEGDHSAPIPETILWQPHGWKRRARGKKLSQLVSILVRSQKRPALMALEIQSDSLRKKVCFELQDKDLSPEAHLHPVSSYETLELKLLGAW